MLHPLLLKTPDKPLDSEQHSAAYEAVLKDETRGLTSTEERNTFVGMNTIELLGAKVTRTHDAPGADAVGT